MNFWKPLCMINTELSDQNRWEGQRTDQLRADLTNSACPEGGREGPFFPPLHCTWLGLLKPELEQVLHTAVEGGMNWNPGWWWLNSVFSSHVPDHPCGLREQLSTQAPQFQHPRLSLPITILKTPGTCPTSFPRLVYLCPAKPLLCSDTMQVCAPVFFP